MVTLSTEFMQGQVKHRIMGRLLMLWSIEIFVEDMEILMKLVSEICGH